MMFDSEGFAKPWLDFEKQVGKRLLFHGPDVANLFSQDEELGGLLLSKLTFPPPDASIKTEDKEISPGLKARVYSPSNYAGDKPVCVHYHGGGWAMGSIDRDDPQARKIAKDVGVIVVSVEYRLAPANPYPAGLDDCVTAYYWALKNAKLLNTTANQVITCGGSAGGNLALSTALKIIDQGLGDTLKGVVAIVPITIAPEAVPEKYKAMYLSYEEHAEHTINTASAMKGFFSAYGADGNDPYVSPLLHPRLKDLSRVYIAVAGQDTLRDDGRLLKLALDEAGVMNRYDEYKGYPHWFWAFPSEYLAEMFAQYNNNVAKGFEFIFSSSS